MLTALLPHVSADWTLTWRGVRCAEHKERGDAKEETNGFREEWRGRERGRGREKCQPLQGLSRTSPRPAADDFWFFPHPLLLWPPPNPATVQSYRLNHSKLLFDGLDKPF